MQNSNIRQKAKQTCIEKYGVENPSLCPEIIDKGWETKKRHGTVNKSKPEDNIYTLLCTKFSEVLRNHKTKLYPFHCDFYIPEIDTYIEYQGYEGHGKEPYDPNNPEHQALIKKWKERANRKESITGKKSRYTTYIDVWTRSDPLKRQTAAANHLNWLEFFTFDEFLVWFDSL